ncbi:MAG: TIGR03790 family protein [Phycisphaerae bacterium]|nr:TIGR03790 family protein [Phycisphaerae bacterium]
MDPGKSRDASTTRSIGHVVCLAIGMIVIGAGVPVSAGVLAADELLLIYNDADPAGKGLAERYAEVRGVPADRLCPLIVLGRSEEIVPGQFERLIRQPVRDYLERHGLREKVRCLVPFYGLPIRVSPRKNTAAERVLLLQWRRQLQETLIELDKVDAELAVLAGEDPATRPTTTQPSDKDLARLAEDYERLRASAFARIMPNPPTREPPPAFHRWVKLVETGEGAARLLAQISTRADAGEDASRALADSQRQGREVLLQARALMSRAFTDPEREKARPLLRQWGGLLDVAYSLQSDMQEVEGRETEAAVDSELMLLWWDHHPRYRWQPNRLNWRQRVAYPTGSPGAPEGIGTQPAGRDERRTLLVCRIDGPTAGVARRIIDESIAVERAGLRGNVAIDARGIRGSQGHGEYDTDLRSLAQLLKDNTSLPVHLDDRSALFADGDCPETMLYCGWYSLRRYVRACAFVPGSVGYHIASFEAAGLKQPKETGWCRGLLLDGMAATLGPVAEPYLHAFPKPTEFFGLLLSGRMTLAECYAYTTPCTSWMMMMIGDPLYRPFGAKPVLTIDQVFPAELIPPEWAGGRPASPAN